MHDDSFIVDKNLQCFAYLRTANGKVHGKHIMREDFYVRDHIGRRLPVWGFVGVWKFTGTAFNETEIDLADIIGKGVRVGQYLIFHNKKMTM